MFEFIKIDKEEECEECGYKDVLVSSIIDGQIKKICQRCIRMNDAIIIKKPVEVREEDVKRRSVHEILESMSGIKPRPFEKPPSEVTLDDLRKRYDEVKAKRKLMQEAEEERKKVEAKKLEEEKAKERVLDEKEFLEIPREVSEAYRELKEKRERGERVFDFSIKAAKRTRIHDLLEKMKRKEAIEEEAGKDVEEKTKDGIEEKSGKTGENKVEETEKKRFK